MIVLVKLSSVLRQYIPGYDAYQGLEYELEPGATVAQVLSGLGIPLEKVKVVMVNGVRETLDRRLEDGDRLGVFPAVGGG